MRMDDPAGFQWIYHVPEAIKEPTIKDALKHGGSLGIEFREMQNPKNFKYSDKKVQQFFAVITSQRLPYILYTQKGIVRKFTEKSAYLWIKELNKGFGTSFKTNLRSDLPFQDPTKPLTVPTDAQLEGNQPDGGPQRIKELNHGPDEYWEQLDEEDKENFEKSKHLWDMMS